MTEDQHISPGNGFGFTPSMKLPETFALPTTGKRVENVKKRGFQPEKSGGSPASTHKKPLICPFWEKASMENHFEFWALKGPKPA